MKQPSTWSVFFGVLPLLAGLTPAHAQQAPQRPGVLEQFRTDERLEEIRKRQENSPAIRLQTPRIEQIETLPEKESPCFVIERIDLKGEGLETFAWLSATLNDTTVADAPVGRCIGKKGIDIVYRRAQNALIEKGFMTTRVYLEAQDIRTGTLTLLLVPGRLRRLEFEGNVSPRWRLTGGSVLKQGDLINLRDVEQTLENLQRVPGVKADIRVLPGDAPGESDLAILYEQQRFLRGSVSFDDGGMRSTGKYQMGLSLFLDNPVGINDTFYLSLNHDLDKYRKREDGKHPGSLSSILHYAFPIKYWTLAVTYSASQNDQRVAGAFVDYRYRSRQRDAEISAGRLLYRDGVSKVSADFGVFRKDYHNYINDVEVEVQRRRIGGWKANIRYQRFIGDKVLAGYAGYRRGTGAFHAISAPEDAFEEGTARYKILEAGINLGMPFQVGGQSFYYRGDLRGQWNFTDLSPTDKFMIAGRHTVRGFDGETVLASERGWLVRNDFILPLANGMFSPYLGVDYGEVHGKTSRFLVGKRLLGAALGLKGGYQGMDYDLFVGAPIYKPDDFKAGGVVGFDFNYAF
ncbi:hemolysin secretion/activation protein, ShlB/FhaC/HecB family [Betaproteobacteria bacterium]|nr:hemolysin secretion/activation protein, ShlB/FhaC/HecB family [Betaproteobacteria bacterium]GHU42007.1 hemolysin secretion/activation protein, ShlB/FhaC/HecB family [Betaproteobacteria bacterium]